MAGQQSSSKYKLSAGQAVEFKRMLSWQLSTPSAVTVKKGNKKATVSSVHHNSDSEGEFDYVVITNSDGEEDVYFSAPESPVSSDSDFSPHLTAKAHTYTHTVSKNTPTKKSAKSKKKKKKVRCVIFRQPMLFNPCNCL